MEGSDKEVHKSGEERKQSAREIYNGDEFAIWRTPNNKPDDDISDEN